MRLIVALLVLAILNGCSVKEPVISSTVIVTEEMIK